MNDKQLLQMLEVLGKNSRMAKSLAPSEVSENDAKCAKTLRNIIENSGLGSKQESCSLSDP